MNRMHWPEMGEVDNIFVRRKAKGQISKLITRKQSTPNFPKNELFLIPDTHTYVCVSGREMLVFGKYYNTRFEICPFVLLPTYYYMWLLHSRLKGHDASKGFLPNFAFTIKRINFCFSWNHQKTIGFLMNSEVIQVSKIHSLKFDSCNGRSEI